MKNSYKFLLALLLLCCFGAAGKAQDSTEQFTPHFLIGTSLTYIWQEDFPTWDEYTLHIDLSYAIARRWNVGINALRLWAGDSSSSINRYWIAGIDGQYNVINDSDFRLFGEGGLYIGNYCTCGRGIPYLRNGNVYWALGGGMTTRIRNNLRLEVGFHSYNIINDTPGDMAYNYTQYIIGLEYQLNSLGKSR